MFLRGKRKLLLPCTKRYASMLASASLQRHFLYLCPSSADAEGSAKGTAFRGVHKAKNRLHVACLCKMSCVYPENLLFFLLNVWKYQAQLRLEIMLSRRVAIPKDHQVRYGSTQKVQPQHAPAPGKPPQPRSQTYGKICTTILGKQSLQAFVRSKYWQHASVSHRPGEESMFRIVPPSDGNWAWDAVSVRHELMMMTFGTFLGCVTWLTNDRGPVMEWVTCDGNAADCFWHFFMLPVKHKLNWLGKSQLTSNTKNTKYTGNRGAKHTTYDFSVPYILRNYTHCIFRSFISRKYVTLHYGYRKNYISRTTEQIFKRTIAIRVSNAGIFCVGSFNSTVETLYIGVNNWKKHRNILCIE